MASPKVKSPYAPGSYGSLVETMSVLNQLLRPVGIARETIADLAAANAVASERDSIGAPASLHLVAIKKALLYATPVVGAKGIALTAQVASPAIRLVKSTATASSLAVGDPFRLLGFAFPGSMINHLAYSIFPQKYYSVLPSWFEPTPLDIGFLPHIERRQSRLGDLFIISPKAYEDVALFNRINHEIAEHLTEEMTVALALKQRDPRVPECVLPHASNTSERPAFLDALNAVLAQKIDATYRASLYETLHLTNNWLLYDLIQLLGFEAPEVGRHMNRLKYVKEQQAKVRQNASAMSRQRLLRTRGERICRERYPHFFDAADRRAIFVHFHQFDIEKLPDKERAEVRILLEKDLAAQEALLANRCEHLAHLHAFRQDSSAHAYAAIAPYIDLESLTDEGMYACRLCQYPLLCVHLVELYDTLAALPGAHDDSDRMYHAQLHIINKFKLVDRRRSGAEGTDVAFTFYCKHCGGELGRSDDAIRASLQLIEGSEASSIPDIYESMINNDVIMFVARNANVAALGASAKMLSQLILAEIKDEMLQFVARASSQEMANIDVMVRYLTHVYVLASLISININKVKSPDSAIRGGAQIKDEFLNAFKIVRAVEAYRQIGVTDAKIKSLIIEAFRFVNRSFASETLIIKALQPRDRLEIDIRSSPLTHYASQMYKTEHPAADALVATGVDLAALFPTSKKAPRVDTHALYTNIFIPSAKPTSDARRYRVESYAPIAELARSEDLIPQTAPLSAFVVGYQQKRHHALALRRLTPVRHLPVENSREHDFQLKIFQLAYCVSTIVRPHRWTIAREDGKLVFTCRYCGLNIDDAAKSNNGRIEQTLLEQMMREAFFDLYTVSCPVKDIHIFVDDRCSLCGATKAQLSGRDDAYYKKYSEVYAARCEEIATGIVAEAKTIMSYSTPMSSRPAPPKADTVDAIALETLASNLGKLFGAAGLFQLGKIGDDRSSSIVQSYLRMFYSHYIFAKNASAQMRGHPDNEFFTLLKKQLGRERTLALKPLPPYPTAKDPSKLLFELFTIISDLMDHANQTTTVVVRYIVEKIIACDQRRQQFDFSRLRAMSTAVSSEQEAEVAATDGDENEDIFDGYDMDAEDAEDNLNGEID